MLRLGIMGGTFDPPHWAHLIMAEQAAWKFNLDRVLFIPAGSPPHKSMNLVTDPEHRYAMVLLAANSNPLFHVSRIEIDRDGPSYSVDTIRQLRGIYGSDTEIYFIIGADEALDIPSWHQAECLPDLATFVIAPRPGFDFEEQVKKLPEKFHRSFELINMQPVYISSTDLRLKVSQGETIRYLVPESVENYICKQGLYLKGSI
ncbi:MAG: nicotinate-nucleotide adenylyltransferase [Armatimonadota bacterium]